MKLVSINVEQKNGFWAILNFNKNLNGIQRPLLKMWCAVH